MGEGVGLADGSASTKGIRNPLRERWLVLALLAWFLPALVAVLSPEGTGSRFVATLCAS